MKWFKHLSGALNDNLIFEAIERFGGDGYLVFFGTLEIMADEFDIHNPGVSRLSMKKLTKNFQVSRQKLVKILSFFDQKAKEKPTESKSFFACFEKDHVVIKCKRLADLCDEHTQKLLKKNRESIPSESGVTPVVEVEEEERIKKKKDSARSKKKVSSKIISAKTKHLETVWLTAEEYQKLATDHGEELTKTAIEILNAYIMSSGKKYKSHYHTLILWPMERAREKGNQQVTGGGNGRYQNRNRIPEPLSREDEENIARVNRMASEIFSRPAPDKA